MPIIKLRDIGSRGLIKDVDAHDVPDGWMTDAQDVRFSARGILRYPTSALKYTASGAVWMSSCDRGSTGGSVFYASPTALYVTDGSGGLANASRTSPAYTQDSDWHSEVYGKSMLFNNASNIPQIIEPGDAQFGNLANWPATTFAKVIRVYKNFFVALNLQEGGIEKTNVLMWSDAAYNNGVPPNWDYNDPTSLSAQATIGAGDGQLVDAKVMGDQLIIYTEFSAHSMQFVGGNFVMQFRELFKFGALNRDCVGVFDKRHFVVGRDHIYVHDGVNVKRVGEGRVERAIYADILDPDTVRVAMNPSAYEATIYFQSTEEGNPHVGWIWNWTYDTWTRVTLATGTLCLHYGPSESQYTQWSDLQTDGTLWSTAPPATWGSWSGKRAQQVMFEMTGSAINIAEFNYDADAYLPYKVSKISRRGIDMDAIPEISSDNIKYISRIYPIMTGDSIAVVSWRFGSSQSPDGDITWTPWAEYQVQGGVKVDTRITGRYLAFEMECPASVAGGWGLTGLDIDVRTAGLR
ncbi:hypothetical protein UFOVP1008_34 [uncultured Caudovirales phage]|uniref:Uncharacterized protein n=1 Tax=uncultured Caudovirales phage TaxID=2100421 RepID=A0A6J5MM64_9CAUD|nr:hypothetical protein UFOVP498_42 [uncultured Caudovirales phage]CAB4177699.1 hypothetical protein UFOVP1008_34 [uncultured Caudovirales phage]CAB4187167.1 hypothetical protein UFOVP1160_12 [uncultured Caudovirales phage]CAB4200226.1 hypothetical protein UFOVP1352_38 [uncultured Caudovirales phage]